MPEHPHVIQAMAEAIHMHDKVRDTAAVNGVEGRMADALGSEEAMLWLLEKQT